MIKKHHICATLATVLFATGAAHAGSNVIGSVETDVRVNRASQTQSGLLNKQETAIGSVSDSNVIGLVKTNVLLLSLPGWVNADFLGDNTEHNGYRVPANTEIELMAVRETSPYGSERPLSVKIKNNSDLYLDRVAIQCTITDQRGYRMFKDIVFKSKPAFSIRIDFPPVRTPEMGITPEAVAEVGLYTDDNRWTRGYGDYSYDCHTSDVDGRQ